MSGIEIKENRVRLGLSQEKLAKLIGVSKRTIINYENGEEIPLTKSEILHRVLLENNNGIKQNETNESQEIQKGVPYYPMDATGSIVGSFQDIKERPEYFIDFRPFNDCDAWLTIYGDSMYPKYSSGDMVAVKQVRKYFQNGEAHLVVTKPEADDLRTIKLVFNHDTDPTKIILRASNPQFKGDLIVEREDILSMWIVKGKVNRSQL